MTSLTPRTRPVERRIGRLGSLGAVVALAMIWLARWSADRPMYVSELGADGEPTARWFEVALLVLVAGAVLVARAVEGVVSTTPVVRRWRPATSLAVAAGLFLVVSQVPCTSGCPLPVGDTFTVQDFVHTLTAVLAFGAASLAMLQMAGSVGRPALRRWSLAAGIGVAGIAATGGMFSLVGFRTDLGGLLELVATSIGVLWLAGAGWSADAQVPVGSTAGSAASTTAGSDRGRAIGPRRTAPVATGHCDAARP